MRDPAAAVLVSSGGNARWEVRRYGLDGSLQQVIRASIPRREIDRALRDEVRQGLIDADMMGAGAPIPPEAFDRLQIPDSTAAIMELHVDQDGRLWVGRCCGAFALGIVPRADTYDIFDANGHWVATASVPPGLGTILTIAGTKYVTKYTTELV